MIDNKISEKERADATKPQEEEKKQEPEKEQEKAIPEPAQPAEPKFHVLDKLVFKFDKDIFKSELFRTTNETIPQNEIVLLDPKTKEKINEEDFEIYVINDTNEICTNLNLDNLVDQNGCINNRLSLEEFSADRLPQDINLFVELVDKNS